MKYSPNTKPKEKKVGGHGILYPHCPKKRGHTFPVSSTKWRPRLAVCQWCLHMFYRPRENIGLREWCCFIDHEKTRTLDKNFGSAVGVRCWRPPGTGCKIIVSA